MKKTSTSKMKFLALLMVLTLVLAASACDMFTSGKDDDKDSAFEPVKITDDLTHEDPADLEFTERYVMTAKDDDDYITGMQDLDELPVRVVMFIYGNDEKALVSYEYDVFETEAGAKAYVDSMQADGFNIEQKGNVSVFYIDEDEMAANLIAYNEWHIMDGQTAKDLSDMFATNFGGLNLEDY
ncbi:MAG: hypothetical protein GX681_01275 [Clostridiaceae bacterium]|nr:hypothetical protein [Clostridiaceae bacterium]